MSSPKPDWIAIEGDYRAGIKSLRAMAAAHGVPESTIRSKAQKMGWVRDPTGTKRRIVADRLAGVAQDAAQCAMRSIEDEAGQDVHDMRDGLTVYRNILQHMVSASVGEVGADGKTIKVMDPRAAKVIAEATEKAITGIRTIRGLDDSKPGNFEDIDAEIEAEISKLAAAREALKAPQTP